VNGQSDRIKCKELTAMVMLVGGDRLNAIEGTRTLNQRFYKRGNCVGRAICDRETAAFNISKIL
jgi:hypothetical protein